MGGETSLGNRFGASWLGCVGHWLLVASVRPPTLLPLLLTPRTSFYLLSTSCSFYLLNSTIYRLLSPDSSNQSLVDTLQAYGDSLSPGPVPPISPPTSVLSSFHYHSIISK